MKFSTRIITLAAALLGMLLITNMISLYSMNKINHSLIEITEEDIPLNSYITEMTIQHVKQSLSLQKLITLAFEDKIDQNKFDSTTAEFNEISDNISNIIASALKVIKNGHKIQHNNINKDIVEKIINELNRIHSEHLLFTKDSNLLIEEVKKNGISKSLSPYFVQITAEESLLTEDIQKLLTDTNAFTKQITSEADSSSQTSKWLILISFLVALLAGITLSYLTYSSVNKQLGHEPLEIMKFAQNISNGDLSPNIDEDKRELSGVYAAMVDMRKQLTEVTNSIKQTTVHVKKGTKEIAQGNSNLSNRTEMQTTNLQQTASSMDTMTNTVRQNAGNAKQADELAQAARKQAEQGGAVVGNAVSAMNGINESSKKIADIIGVIDEIAFQTNLLALNAAVEAARAGEQGRGFAVVASEVRSLASRSATAAKEIKELIQDSVNKIEDGADLVNKSGETLNGIVVSVQKVSDIITEISLASQEQSAGIDQVSKAVMQMDDLTQQNAALVDEVATNSKTIGSKANELCDSLGFFKNTGIDLENDLSNDNANELGAEDSEIVNELVHEQSKQNDDQHLYH